MKNRVFVFGSSLLLLIQFTNCSKIENEISTNTKTYDIEVMYDENQPQPKVVTPPPAESITSLGMPPSDAIVLFDGTDASGWVGRDGGPIKWNVENGYMETVERTGDIHTVQSFGSCQLHVEFATPMTVTGESQDRGNSGVYLMSTYEIQVLDSYNNRTYPSGMAASVYGQNPPLVNASRGPGEWQSYDIIFHSPVFENGKLVKPAVVTVIHNGVLVQDNFEMIGGTVFKKVPHYEEHADRLPLLLQNHRNPVRFRNIWIREID